MAISTRAGSAAAVVLLLTTLVSPTRADEPWAPYQFLIGEWAGDSDSDKGSGKFTLEPDLDGKVLVRRNHADIPASQGRAAATHDDLMVIYREEPGKPSKAIYFDSEAHVIHYNVSFSDDKRTLTFLSDASQSGPRYRLTYVNTGPDAITIKFEIAAPGKADEFKTYLEGKARRTRRRQ
jgi:hypothetical protein